MQGILVPGLYDIRMSLMISKFVIKVLQSYDNFLLSTNTDFNVLRKERKQQFRYMIDLRITPFKIPPSLVCESAQICISFFL